MSECWHRARASDRRHGARMTEQMSFVPLPVSRWVAGASRVPPRTCRRRGSSAAGGRAWMAVEQQVDEVRLLMGAAERAEVWTRNWVPLWTLQDLPVDRPTQATVLGQDLVVYRAGGEWVVQRDQCPHRLAPLSEGRINERGHLECAYHGWSFDAGGRCTRVPDADPAVHDAACNRVPCVATFPTKEALGILWAWLDRETAPLAHSTELPVQDLADVLGSDAGVDIETTTFMRFQPINAPAVLEHLLDPAHVRWSHHGVEGNRYSTGIKVLAYVEDASREEAGGFSVQEPGTANWRQFIAPFTVIAVAEMGPFKSAFLANAVPVRPGLTCLIVHNAISGLSAAKGPAFAAVAAFALAPKGLKRWQYHRGINRVLDMDTVQLGASDENLDRAIAHAPSVSDWRSAVHINNAADTAVVRFRAWFDKYASGRVPYAPGTRPRAPLYPVSDPGYARPDVVIDRFEQHTRHCATCMGAYRNLNKAVSALGWFAAGDVITMSMAGPRLGWGVVPMAGLCLGALVAIRHIQTGPLQDLVWRENKRP